MPRTYDQTSRDLAERWMQDARQDFPASDYDALVHMLAQEIQGVCEDFVNPDYREITMKHLRRRQEAETRS